MKQKMPHAFSLTHIGECEVPSCRAPVFAELQTLDAPLLCHDCAPLLVERQRPLRGLFERSGGRLPADFGRVVTVFVEETL